MAGFSILRTNEALARVEAVTAQVYAHPCRSSRAAVSASTISSHLWAAGGMGEVYRARDTRLGRIVAIKFISSETLLRSWRRELARVAKHSLASSLNHPNIVTGVRCWRGHGPPYIVMELIDGGIALPPSGDLGPAQEREVLEIACQVADGLAAAHSAGVVHRDPNRRRSR